MSANVPVVNVNSRPRIVPVVLPPSNDRTLSGKIRNLAVRGADTSGWLQVDEESDTGFALTRAMERKGYRLLEDYYSDERNSEGWDAYKRYLKDWQIGKTTLPFPVHLLPQKVQDLQRGNISAEFADPWNLPAPAPTTGAASEPKAKAK